MVARNEIGFTVVGRIMEMIQRQTVPTNIEGEHTATPNAVEMIPMVNRHSLVESDPVHAFVVGHRLGYTTKSFAGSLLLPLLLTSFPLLFSHLFSMTLT